MLPYRYIDFLQSYFVGTKYHNEMHSLLPVGMIPYKISNKTGNNGIEYRIFEKCSIESRITCVRALPVGMGTGSVLVI